ncbi:hypothetical protein [Bosea sp. BK604]|uniref:hypothetical protein n=1 Tax=Bosea sp. BK604 TaxID=2512180 RepID=UPI001046DC51|nr:hypothetical protein [Bosea sp. BK604]TCR68725.1 hypothetical protein EV560_102554 [Bosea sp. BK604]
MRLALIIAAMVPAVLALPAAGRPLERELPPKRDACWERVYDEAHLGAHPGQKVARIRLVHLPSRWADAQAHGFYVTLYINLRQHKAATGFDYQLGGFCKPSGEGLRCEPEWEAGTWRIERGPNGTLRVRNNGITANPNPYDAEEIADNAVRIPAKPDDGIWQLAPASGRCELE